MWLSADPLSGYNPVMETEHYIDGQHNGGVFNSFNLNTYGYCYQNPVLYVDPNGKQSEFHDGYMSPAEMTGAAINEVRAAVSNITARVVSLFTKEEVTPRYVVSGAGRLILVPDMPEESTREKVVNSAADMLTIALAAAGGAEGTLYAKTGKSGSILIAKELTSKLKSGSIGKKLAEKLAKYGEDGKLPTPDSNKSQFKTSSGEIVHKGTGSIYRKSNTTHRGKNGEYKIWPKGTKDFGKTSKTTGQRITTTNTGEVIGH